MPNEITSCIVATISKNLRIPDGLRVTTFSAKYFLFTTSPYFDILYIDSYGGLLLRIAKKSDLDNAPFIGYVIDKFKYSSIGGLDAKTLSIGDTGSIEDFIYNKALPFPGEGSGPFGVFEIGMAFDQIWHS